MNIFTVNELCSFFFHNLSSHFLTHLCSLIIFCCIYKYISALCSSNFIHHRFHVLLHFFSNVFFFLWFLQSKPSSCTRLMRPNSQVRRKKKKEIKTEIVRTMQMIIWAHNWYQWGDRKIYIINQTGFCFSCISVRCSLNTLIISIFSLL